MIAMSNFIRSHRVPILLPSAIERDHHSHVIHLSSLLILSDKAAAAHCDRDAPLQQIDCRTPTIAVTLLNLAVNGRQYVTAIGLLDCLS